MQFDWILPSFHGSREMATLELVDSGKLEWVACIISSFDSNGSYSGLRRTAVRR